MVRVLAAILLSLLSAPAGAFSGNGYSDIAKGIGKAGKRAGIQKVQILPFVSVTGDATPEGRMIASRIMAELIDQGKVLVVDGDLPSHIPDPYAVAMRLRKRNVRPAAEAVVMGSYMSGGAKLHVDVQLLRVQDRVVLYSANKKVKNEWEGASSMADLRPLAPEPKEAVQLAADPVGLDPADKEADEIELIKQAWDDSALSENCAGAAVEVDRLQSSILDIKARYVARKLKQSKRHLADQPPSLIQNAELRSQFDLAVQQYLDSSSIPPLTRREIRSLLVIDGKSFEIHRRCSAARS